MTEPIDTGETRRLAERRIRHAKETNAALRRFRVEPTNANVVALHELHATHLRETGDEEAAARADDRARRAKESGAAGFDRSCLPTLVRPRTALDDDTAAPTRAERERAREATQVQYAQTASQRADAALQRAVEGSERADAHDARAKAGHERSAAARRRLLSTEARRDASVLRSPLEDDRSDDRDRAADERERVADERERHADERDRRADRRDKTADRRERAADERERIADERQRLLDAFDGS
jgi:sulfite oxidase